MTQLVVLPHVENCPDGAVIEAREGESICLTLLENGIAIEHACEMSCACTTCHVIVREGFASLNELDETEEDLLDRAWGLAPNSRLSCLAPTHGCACGSRVSAHSRSPQRFPQHPRWAPGSGRLPARSGVGAPSAPVWPPATVQCGLTIRSSRRHFVARLNSGVSAHESTPRNLCQ